MGNHLKKLLAVLMTLTMLLGMLPAATLAEMAEDAAAETAAVVSEVKEEATEEPTAEPTEEPTAEPTEEPTEEPTPEPTEEPTPEPTEEPAEEPTQSPIEEDGEGDGGEEGDPTFSPTEEPEDDATVSPTEEPEDDATASPTEEPEDDATVSPTEEPEAEVTQTPAEDAVEEVTVYLTLSGKDEITVGKSATLSAKNEKGNTVKNANISWTSSDKAIATVKSGVVTAKAPGSVTITGTTKSGRVGVKEIEILPKASSLTLVLDGEELPAKHTRIANYTEEKSLQLSAKLLPAEASQAVSWKSSDSAIAKVSSDGNIEYKKPGTVTITATAKDGSKKAASLTLKIRRFVTDIEITGKEGLACGKKTTLKAKVTPSNASVKGVKWASSDTAVASINSEGLVTAKTVTEPTEVIITASAKDGSGIVGSHSLWIHPAAKKVQILKDGEDAGSSLIMDLVGAPEVTLTARVFEDNAYQGVSWKSSASSIVKVENGVLTARKPGKATITATAKDGTGKKDTITVTVRRFVTDITITGKDALACGKKTTLKAKVTPSNASIKSVKWASSDKTVASIDSEGLVTAKTVTEPTEVIITASAKDGSGIIGSHSLWIHPAAKSVQILKDGEDAGKSAIIDFTNNPTLTLTSAIAPENAYQGVSWKSSNTAVATIEDGVITALKPGTVTITATAKDGTGKKDTLTVYVRRFVTGIEITGSTSVIAPGKTKTLKAVVSPSNATMKSVKWTSSDTTIAKVSSSGVVTAATGLNRIATVTITATAKDGSGVSAQFEVSVGKDSKVYRALLIGNTYPGTSNYLPGPDNDLAGMKKMLARQTKTKYSVSTRENVTAGQIESAIYDTFEYADANDVSLFYYSGHGTSSGSLCGTGNTYVTVDNLRTYLDTVPGTKIVILDSCYSGTHINRSASRSSDSETTIVQNADPSDFNDAVLSAFSSSVYSRANLATGGYVVLTACSKNEESFSVSYDGEEYVGAFTYSLTLGSGWDMLDKSTCTRYSDSLGNQNGKIELYEAYGFAVAMVDEMMYGNQNVQFWGSDGDFVLWRYK